MHTLCVDINGLLLETTVNRTELSDLQNFIDWHHEQLKNHEVYYVYREKGEVEPCSGNKMTSKPYVPCHVGYVVHGDVLWEEYDWNNSPDCERYDDIIRCKVDIKHPNYPVEEEGKFEQEMLDYWAKGVKPPYVE